MTTLDSFIGNKEKSVEVKPPVIYDFQPWTKKYAPKKQKDLVAQEEVFKKIKFFIENYSKSKKKALLLFGPSGVGKSCCVYALTDYEIVELNASDSRSKSVIEEKLGNCLNQQSLFSENKVILIDDIEGISGFYDRGGAIAITKLMEKSSFPIIMTCQDPYSKKISSLRKKCELLGFDAISEKLITEKLLEICEKENIVVTNEDCLVIAKNAKGDLRAAINDLQMLSMGNKFLDVNILGDMTSRLQNEDMQFALTKIFKSVNSLDVLDAFDKVEGAYDQNILWLDYNMPIEYTKKTDRAKAYGVISKADVFTKRIMKRQHWRFLVYINALLTAGITTSKEKVYESKISYQQSSRILKIWQMNMRYSKRQAIAQKIAELTHSSKKEIIKDFDYYKIMSKNAEYAQGLGLDEDEIQFLSKI
jgi:replication factor C large subunit